MVRDVAFHQFGDFHHIHDVHDVMNMEELGPHALFLTPTLPNAAAAADI